MGEDEEQRINRRIADAEWRTKIEHQLHELHMQIAEQKEMTSEAVNFIAGMRTLGALIKWTTGIVGGLTALYWFAKTGDASTFRDIRR